MRKEFEHKNFEYQCLNLRTIIRDLPEFVLDYLKFLENGNSPDINQYAKKINIPPFIMGNYFIKLIKEIKRTASLYAEEMGINESDIGVVAVMWDDPKTYETRVDVLPIKDDWERGETARIDLRDKNLN